MLSLSDHHKNALLKSIQREWNALLSVVDSLSSEQMNAPDAGGWSPKDNLAHLSEWMKVLMGYHMDKRPSHEVLGVPEEITKDWDMNIINPVLFERNRNRSAEDVLSELKKVHDELISKIERMSIDELMQPRRADDPQKRPLVLWILGDSSEHYAEHRATIQKVLQ